ncbi:MAG: DNA polymerase III subunit gamma/tau [Geobacter sp.]|nr:DNA polymerase III subunit gamma/tau [Geobacter sp.]
MSYLVLARKWRPQTFRDLIGQEHVSQTLQNAITSGRVAHAFLFTGARGVGKTSSARILAKALTCEQGPTIEPCNACPACQEITNGTSVDVFEIDGASNTSVDDIRELREGIKYLPSRLRYKIFIIDEVHMLSTNAFNALLKTLEEPPPHVKFIFATTEPHKIPITILSRCQRFDFRRISLAKLLERLRHIVDSEGVAISDEALAVIARKGDGSMRDSLSILDQVLAFCSTTVSDEDVTSLLGVVDRRLLHDAAQAVIGRDTAAALDIARRVDTVGYSMRQFCQEMIGYFRGLAIVLAVPDPASLLDISESELQELRELAATAPLDDVQRHLTILLKADTEMTQTAFPRLVLELALLKMARLAPVVPAQLLIERLKTLESGGGGTVASPAPRWESAPRPVPRQPEPQSQKQQPASRENAQVQPSSTKTVSTIDWPTFVEFVKGRRVGIAALLEHGSPLTVSPEHLKIAFPPGSFYLTSLQDPENLAALKTMAREFLGHEPTIQIIPLAAGSTAAPPNLLEKKKCDEARELSELKCDVRQNQLVEGVLETFNGEIAGIRKLS